MGKKWKYKVESIQEAIDNDTDGSLWNSYLDAMGYNGWELTTIVGDKAFFKKEKELYSPKNKGKES